MMQKQIALMLLAGIVFTGCSGEPTHDVQYYLNHVPERSAKIADCRNNPGEKRIEPNCVNAREAERQAGLKGDGMPSIK